MFTRWAIGFGIVSSIVVSSIVYNAGSPWDCDQAKSMYFEAKQEEKDVRSRIDAGEFPSLSHAGTAVMDIEKKVWERTKKATEMCRT